MALSLIVSPTANRCPAAGASMVTTGGVLPGSMRAVAGGEAEPSSSRTTRVAVYVPAAV